MPRIHLQHVSTSLIPCLPVPNFLTPTWLWDVTAQLHISHCSIIFICLIWEHRPEFLIYLHSLSSLVQLFYTDTFNLLISAPYPLIYLPFLPPVADKYHITL